jgi:hypothetical protein
LLCPLLFVNEVLETLLFAPRFAAIFIFFSYNVNIIKIWFNFAEIKSLKASKTAKKNWKFKNLARVQYAYVQILIDLGVIDPKGIVVWKVHKLFCHRSTVARLAPPTAPRRSKLDDCL